MPTVEIALAWTANRFIYKALTGSPMFGNPVPAGSDFRAKAICTEEILYGADLCTWHEKSDTDLYRFHG